MTRTPTGALVPRADAVAVPWRCMARALMWIHLAYLLAIPLLGVVCLRLMQPHEWTAGAAVLGGWVAASVYLAFQVKFYRLPRRPLTAALSVAVVPAQVLLHVLLFDGGFTEYCVEEAFVELASLSLALALVMLAYRPSGWGGAALGVVIAAVAIVGFGLPVAEEYRRHAVGYEVWTLLALVLVSGTWAHVRLTAPAARFEVSTPEAQPGWLRRAIERVAPDDGEALTPDISDGVVSVLLIIQIGLWLAVPPLAVALT